MYREDWNIADVANLGPNFRMDFNTARIASGVALGPASLNVGAWATYQGGANSGKMNSDNMIVSTQLVTPPNGTFTNTVQTGWCAVRKPDTWATTGAPGTFAIFGCSASGAWAIYSCIQATATSRASGSGVTLVSGDILSFAAIGTWYQGYKNGVPIAGATWNDASNAVVGVGATKRRWGTLIQVSANNLQGLSPDWMSATDPAQFFAAA